MPNTFKSEQRQTLLWLSVGVVFLFLLWLLTPVLTPFVAAIIIGYVLNPGVDWMERRRVPRVLGVLVAIVALGLAIAALVLVVLPILADELPLLRERIPVLLAKIDAAIGPWLRQMGAGGRLDFAALQKAVATRLTAGDGATSAVLTWLRIGGSALMGWAATLFLIPIVLFYLLLDWHRVIARIGETVPRRWSPQVTEMATEADQLLAQYLRGQLLVMFLLAAYYSAGLAIAGFDIALPVGMLTGLLVFIPYIGFGLGLVLAIVAALLQFDGWYGLAAVAVVYGIGQFIESFYLTPRLVGERIGLHPLTVIFALLAFGQLFGFVGILLALPASAILSVVFGRLRRHYLNSSFYNQS
ncbi:MAG: AI-2E family transporter [Burkholderiaceae bacterium]|nr:AI-2E family transporter [Burkholderiaceae bacterium]